MTWNLSLLAQMVDGVVDGDPAMEITGVAGLEDAYPGSIVFADSERALRIAEASEASVLLLSHNEAKVEKPSLRVKRPRLAFAKIARLFVVDYFQRKGINSRAYIHENAKLGNNVTVHPYAIIEDGAIIGDNSVIGHGSFIGHHCILGTNVTIYPSVQVVAATKIGDNSIIHSGVVIGCDGFGYINTQEGHCKMPQLGKVVIEEDVEIGANSVVARATMTETRIRKGTKIDCLVMIGHNVTIGEDCILVGQVGIAGSSSLGNGVILGGQVGVSDHVQITDGVLVSGKAGVTKDITKPGKYFGFPAQEYSKAYKNQAVFNRLSKYQEKISALEKRIAVLEKEMTTNKG